MTGSLRRPFAERCACRVFGLGRSSDRSASTDCRLPFFTSKESRASVKEVTGCCFNGSSPGAVYCVLMVVAYRALGIAEVLRAGVRRRAVVLRAGKSFLCISVLNNMVHVPNCAAADIDIHLRLLLELCISRILCSKV